MQNSLTESKGWLVAGIALAFLAIAIFCLEAYRAPAAGANQSGEKIYTANCASCHAAGGNIVNPNKPLKGSKKLGNKELLKALLMKPVGSMPPFPQIAGNDGDLSALFAYCKNLK
jgi:cytochrome c6